MIRRRVSNDRTPLARLDTPEKRGQIRSVAERGDLPRHSKPAYRRLEGIQLLRCHLDREAEFVTIMSFASLDAVREFAGKAYEVAAVPEKAGKLLSRFDEAPQHYEVREERKNT